MHKALPNFWNSCNLHESPYFQGTLGGDGSRHPLSLFVGRSKEQGQLIRVIMVAGTGSSRQAVGGPPGVGKTTLIQAVKGQLLDVGYWTRAGLIQFYPNDTPALLLGRILAAVYDTILTFRPHTQADGSMNAAQQLVRAVRLTGGGGSFTVLGAGAGRTTSQAAVNPPDALLIEGPRLIRDLLELMRHSGAAGLVLHLNNLENLSDTESRAAGEMFRSLRDTVLLLDGLHLIIVGTTEAVLTVTQSHAQIRTVFTGPLLLDPLPQDELRALLTARYDHLRLDPVQPVIVPVDTEAVEALYPLFRGDLRGILKALEEGATQLLGVEPTPIKLPALRATLKERYKRQIETTIPPTRMAQLDAWGKTTPSAAQTQQGLGKLWRLSQPAVSRVLGGLISEGYVASLPRQGADQVQYILTGISRLAYD